MKEVILENSRLRIVALPELGGKIISFVEKSSGFELAAEDKTRPFRPCSKGTDGFCDYAVAGMDDAFPCIDREEIAYQGRTYSYPDHGEIWRSAMTCRREEDTLVMESTSQGFPYAYRKIWKLEDNALKISYHIENTGAHPFPCIWTLHALMRLEPDMQIVCPDGVHRFENALDTDAEEKAPALITVGRDTLFTIPPFKHPYMMKYYCPDAVRGNVCGLNYPASGICCRIRYDSKALPWFGFWLTAGKFLDGYNIALEITNGYYDRVSRALASHRIAILKPGIPLEFSIAICLEKTAEHSIL